MKIVIFNKGHDNHYAHGWKDGDVIFVYHDDYPRTEGYPGLDSVIDVPDQHFKDVVDKLMKTSKQQVTTFRGKLVEAIVPEVRIRFDLLPQHAQDKILVARKGVIPFGLLKNAMFKRDGKKWDED